MSGTVSGGYGWDNEMIEVPERIQESFITELVCAGHDVLVLEQEARQGQYSPAYNQWQFSPETWICHQCARVVITWQLACWKKQCILMREILQGLAGAVDPTATYLPSWSRRTLAASDLKSAFLHHKDHGFVGEHEMVDTLSLRHDLCERVADGTLPYPEIWLRAKIEFLRNPIPHHTSATGMSIQPGEGEYTWENLHRWFKEGLKEVNAGCLDSSKEHPYR